MKLSLTALLESVVSATQKWKVRKQVVAPLVTSHYYSQHQIMCYNSLQRVSIQVSISPLH